MDPDEQLPPIALGRNLWALKTEARRSIAAMQRHGPTADWTALVAAAPRPVARRVAARQRSAGAVAVIPLCGVLTPRGSWLSMLFGGGSGGLQGFRESFAEAVNDPAIGAIVIDVDSPGGMYDLCPETAADVFEARGSKPIIAIANTCAASGAYWIASQADELVVTPSGDVGSIGVYMLHEDWSAFNERVGINPTFVTATESPYKVDGNMEQPLSESAEADWQQRVDDIYDEFAAAVAQGRGITVEQVIETYGRGRCPSAARALAAGMVDRIDTIESVIQQLLSPTADDGASVAAPVARPAVAAPRAEDPAAADDEPEPTAATEDTPAPAVGEYDEEDDDESDDEDDAVPADQLIPGDGEPLDEPITLALNADQRRLAASVLI